MLSLSSSRSIEIILAALIFLCPGIVHAQGLSAAEKAKNITYAHPPESAVAAKPQTMLKPGYHPPPPAPYAKPKVAAAPVVNRGALPHVDLPGSEKEDPDNLIRNWQNRRPMEEVQRAVKESLSMPSEPHVKKASKTASLSEGVTADVLSTTGWEQIGQGDYNTDGVHYEAGRIRQASYAYDNGQGATVLWLGATGGGLWKAVLLSSSVVFVPVSDSLPGSPSVGAFLVQPGNSDNILIGSGDLYRYGGTGMYQSTDGGDTWHTVSPTDGTSWPSSFQKILIDLNDTSNNTVLAQGDAGIWRSTNFGSTWTQVYSGSTTDLVQDPVNHYIWYAGAPGLGVLRSTDYGSTWAATGTLFFALAGPIGRVSVAVSASAPEHVYAITATVVGGVSQTLGGIYRSDDYGDGAWALLEPTDNISGQGQAFHTTSINVDPNNADIVFAGIANSEVTYNATAAVPTWSYSIKSFDEGHADHTGFLFEPGTSNVISTTDGGIYVHDENSLSVSGSLNYGTNLNVQQVYLPVGALACSLNDPDQCAVGLQDNGSILLNRNNNAPLINVLGGDGGPASVSPDNADEMLVMDDGGRYYTTDDFGSLIGDYGSCLPNNYYANTMIDQTPNAPLPLIYTYSGDGSGDNNVYVYYKGVGSACSWVAANGYGTPFNTSTFNPRQLDASNDPGGWVFYVGGWGTGALKVLDSYIPGNVLDAMNYVDRTPPLASNSTNNDSQIAADRSSSRPYTVTYVTGGSRPSQAFISNDRGQSWTEVTGDLATKLPDASYWKLVANPGDQTQLFLGTDQGVYRSDNGGVNWYRYMNGMPAVTDIYGLELNYDYSNPPLLHVGTFGRGFWDRQVGPDAVLTNISFNPSMVTGGQAVVLTATLDRPAPQDISINLISSNYSVLSVPTFINIPQGSTQASLVLGTPGVNSATSVTVTGSYNQQQFSPVLTVTPDSTTTTLTSSYNPSSYGQSVTFVATVSAGSVVPNGVVGFYDGSTPIANVLLGGGQASFTTSTLTGGTHSIRAAYDGAAGFSTSSATISQVVSKASTVTRDVSSTNPAAYGQPITFTATVSSTSSGAMTGTVAFKDGSTTIGTGTVTGGHATLTTSKLTIGSHPITASYGGDVNFNGSSSGPIAEVVAKAVSSASISASSSSSEFGQSVTFTARITSSGTSATGSVSFEDGSTTLGSATLNNEIATFTTAALAIGSHSITVSYPGNAEVDGSKSGTSVHTVTKINTVEGITASLNPSIFKQAVVFTAAVRSTTTGVPTGSVTLKDGSATLATETLNSSGTATFSITSLAPGSHSIAAVYSGNAEYNSGTSSTLSHTVNKDSATTTVTASLNPSIFKQAVVFTAAIKSASGIPTGSVAFKDGSTTLATETLNSSGQATFSTTSLAVGNHSIGAAYSGSVDFDESTSSTLSHTVNKDSSTTTVTASVNPSIYKQAVVFTAAVKSTSGIPTGSVAFKDGSATLATETLNSSGQATFSTTSLAVGGHSITAVYAGSADFNGSTSSTLSHTVNKGSTTTAVTASVNPSVFKQAVIFTAAVKSTSGIATGSVAFKDGSATLATETLNSSGQATFSTTSLAVGAHSITVVYAGSVDLNGSTSPTLSHTVNK